MNTSHLIVNNKNGRFVYGTKDKLDKSRVIFLVIGLSIIFLALILRIYYLQFIRGGATIRGLKTEGDRY